MANDIIMRSNPIRSLLLLLSFSTAVTPAYYKVEFTNNCRKISFNLNSYYYCNTFARCCKVMAEINGCLGVVTTCYTNDRKGHCTGRQCLIDLEWERETNNPWGDRKKRVKEKADSNTKKKRLTSRKHPLLE